MEEIGFLLLTCALEAPIAHACLPKTEGKRVFLIVFFVNLITHPIAWQLVSTHVSWLVVETGVLLFEAGVFALLFPDLRRRAACAAIAANAVSAFIGAILF